MKKVRLVIWDLDGTLLESEKYLVKVEIDTFRRFGLEVPVDLPSQYLGLTMSEYIHKIGEKFAVKLPVEKIKKVIIAKLKSVYRNEIPLVIHVKETLRALQGTVLQALATSREKESAAIAIKRYSLRQYFQTMIFAEDVDKGKPDPEIFLKVASQLNIQPKNCLVVEDSKFGILAAKTAGMLTIGRLAQHNKKEDFHSSDYIVTDLSQIPKIISNINSA